MDSGKLRQRLLGAAVVVSLGFIGYSLLLQPDPKTAIDRSTQIPLQTHYIEPLDFEEPKVGSADIPAPDPREMFVESETVEPADVVSVSVLNDKGTPNSWVIKVGAFSLKERAIEIRDQLIEAGFKAYSTSGQSDKDPSALHRVLVGPYIDGDEVVAHQVKIDALLGLETLLMTYEP